MLLLLLRLLLLLPFRLVCCCCCCCCCGFSASVSAHVAVGIMTFPAAAVPLAACSDASQRWVAMVVGYAATVGMRACKQPPRQRQRHRHSRANCQQLRRISSSPCALLVLVLEEPAWQAGQQHGESASQMGEERERESATQITPLFSRAASSMQTREERQSANVCVLYVYT